MTTYYWIRHGATDYIGYKLSGQQSGVHLNNAGREQAVRVASYMKSVRLDAIYSSPMERTLETAEPLARETGLAVQIRDAFTELNFGAWTGRALSDLDPDSDWVRFNRFRSSAKPPLGELMLEVQVRVVNELERLRLKHLDQTIAIYSHADVIRAALCHYAGMPLDMFHRLEISPASVSVLTLDETGPRILGINRVS